MSIWAQEGMVEVGDEQLHLNQHSRGGNEHLGSRGHGGGGR